MAKVTISKKHFSTSVRLPLIGDIINIDWSNEEVIIDGLDLNEVAALCQGRDIAIGPVLKPQLPMQHVQNNRLPSPQTDKRVEVNSMHLPECGHFPDSEYIWVGRNNVHVKQHGNHKYLACSNCEAVALLPVSKQIVSQLQ